MYTKHSAANNCTKCQNKKNAEGASARRNSNSYRNASKNFIARKNS